MPVMNISNPYRLWGLADRLGRPEADDQIREAQAELDRIEASVGQAEPSRRRDSYRPSHGQLPASPGRRHGREATRIEASPCRAGTSRWASRSRQLAKNAEDPDGLRDHSGFQLLMIDLAFPADPFAGP